ncbi:MAG TPA: Smr/MutS family protein [Usitatibacteraceae bacterium]|nr:Smr/MutS family protein [Usitatibacteraceae bacterium]
MPKIPPAPPAAECDEFRAEMQVEGVRPIAAPPRANLAPPRPKPLARQRAADEAAVARDSLQGPEAWDAGIDSGDLIHFLRPGLPAEVLRKLRHRHWVCQASIDLHGLTGAAAKIEMARFLGHARHQGLRCVRIIHGRGNRSPHPIAVLRNTIRRALTRRDEVLAFCDAAPADGGEGAVEVLLKGS